MPTTRRAFVLALTTGIAGCTAMPADSPRSPPGSQRTDTDHSPPGESTPNDCTSGYHVSLSPFSPTEDLPMRVDTGDRSLVAAAVDGEATVETVREAPLDRGVVAHEGAYYWLDITSSSGTEIPAFLFDISWENGRTAPGSATLFAYEDLPENDRRAVQFLVPGGDGERLGHPTESFTGRERPVPYPDGGEGSELLAYDTVWVSYEGREYRLAPGGRTTTERHRYRYAAEQIARDDAMLRSWAADRYLVDLSPSDAQRALLDHATGDYYEECAPPSDALADLQSQLSDDDRLPNPAAGWYVAVDGTRHRLDILQWVE